MNWWQNPDEAGGSGPSFFELSQRLCAYLVRTGRAGGVNGNVLCREIRAARTIIVTNAGGQFDRRLGLIGSWSEIAQIGTLALRDPIYQPRMLEVAVAITELCGDVALASGIPAFIALNQVRVNHDLSAAWRRDHRDPAARLGRLALVRLCADGGRWDDRSLGLLIIERVEEGLLDDPIRRRDPDRVPDRDAWDRVHRIARGLHLPFPDDEAEADLFSQCVREAALRAGPFDGDAGQEEWERRVKALLFIIVKSRVRDQQRAERARRRHEILGDLDADRTPDLAAMGEPLSTTNADFMVPLAGRRDWEANVAAELMQSGLSGDGLRKQRWEADVRRRWDEDRAVGHRPLRAVSGSLQQAVERVRAEIRHVLKVVMEGASPLEDGWEA